MPSRSQVDPIEIPKLLPIILLANWATTGTTIRLLGTEATSGFGREIRGRLVDTVDFGDFTPGWTEAFRDVVRTAAPVFAAGRFHNGIEHCAVELVLLPLSDDGAGVSHIVGGMVIRSVARIGAVASNGAIATYMSSGTPTQDLKRNRSCAF